MDQALRGRILRGQVRASKHHARRSDTPDGRDSEARIESMTRAELDALTARAERLDRILRALRAFKDCRYELDVAAAERDLQAALDSAPKNQVDKLGG